MRGLEVRELCNEAGVTLFEHILEHGCQAGGNGHHVAQDFINKYREEVKATEKSDSSS